MTSKHAGDRLIKKYPNRRLYDTTSSSYVTLLDVKQLVLDHTTFKVVDARTGDDLTRSILLQIILEEESGGMPMFSSAMLSQIIRFYGHAMQGMMGSYLESTLQQWMDLQRTFAPDGASASPDAPAAAHASVPPVNPFDALKPEAWAAGLPGLPPAAPEMQAAMSRYVGQSQEMFAQMQARMAEQSQGLFPGFPFAAPSRAPGAAQPDAETSAAPPDDDSAPAASCEKPLEEGKGPQPGKKAKGAARRH